jgi:hypothetical protein
MVPPQFASLHDAGLVTRAIGTTDDQRQLRVLLTQTYKQALV